MESHNSEISDPENMPGEWLFDEVMVETFFSQ